MTIACLAWGSLVWDARDLPLGGPWHEDGALLPIEFARESADGRITLVVVGGGSRSPVLWAELLVPDLEAAVAALAARESVLIRESIGRWPARRGLSFPHQDVIGSWAEERGLAGVVWTALKPGMQGRRGFVPTLDELVRHLHGLDARSRDNAAAYIRNAPRQIRTAYRPALEAELG